MSEEKRPEQTAGAEVPGELAQTQASARRTPDESTMGLPSSAEALPASTDEADFPHLQPGELLAGRFAILRFIARGGMGAVYEANDVMLRSRVALKLIRGRVATDAAVMERFRREVLLARRVGHPNVCRVYELYEATTASGVPIHFLTMEFLEGETLSQRITREGPLTTVDALPLVRQMCEGLAAAHAEGVIHRDFKSSNVMLVARRDGSSASTDSSSRVAITDFGIARAMQLAVGETSDEQLTGGAGILGTPEYMAPEQVTGTTVTKAADIYALGVVLYEVVTGKLPFTADTPLAAAAKRLTEAPPRPEETTPGLDARWNAAILRCLEREPERRFNSALDVTPELERPLRRHPRLSIVNALVLAGLAAGVAFVGYIALPRFQKHPPHTTVAAAPAPRPVLAILGFRDELASPELAWLPTAVGESLQGELEQGQTSLQLITSDRVAMERRSLGASLDSMTDEKVRAHMQELVAANFLAYGTLKLAGQGSSHVVLSVKMLSAETGRELVVLEEDLGEGAVAMSDKVSTIADRLRQEMGVSLSPEEAAGLPATRARNLSALKSYAEGLTNLWNFEFAKAATQFQAALATDGSFVKARIRLAVTRTYEGNRIKARQEYERLLSRPGVLTTRQRAVLDARSLSVGPEPDKGTEALRALFDATPDDIDIGTDVIDLSSPQVGNAILSRLRELPAPASGDVWLDLYDAANAWQLGNPKRAEELFDRVRARASAIDAGIEMAQVLWEQANQLDRSEARPAEALVLVEASAREGRQVGDLMVLSNILYTRAWLMANRLQLPTKACMAAFEDVAALDRRIGRSDQLAQVLVEEAYMLFADGDNQLAEAKYRESLAESEALGEAPGQKSKLFKARLALAHADMDLAREAIRALRKEPPINEEFAQEVEVGALVQQDRFQEAREALKGLVAAARARGDRALADERERALCTLDCNESHSEQGLKCLSDHAPLKGMSPLEAAGFSLALAQCHYLGGELEGAEQAAIDAEAKAGRWANIRVRATAIEMRVRAARGETNKAIASLRANLSEAENKRAKALAFELALALGEVELRARRAEGRIRLLKLEQEANSKQFFRIARLAREALDGKAGPVLAK